MQRKEGDDSAMQPGAKQGGAEQRKARKAWTGKGRAVQGKVKGQGEVEQGK